MRKSRVLVIDDDTSLCKLVETLLRDAGYEVEVSHDGATGLQAIDARPPDLILLDMVLPRMNGWAFLRKLADRTARPPVVICSAQYCEPEPLGELEKYIWAYIKKPFNAAFLLQTCDRVCGAVARTGSFNRRAAPRCHASITTTLLSTNGTPIAEGEVKNISGTGAQLSMNKTVAEGQILRLRFNVGRGARPIHLKARVAWVKEGVMGVAFIGLTGVQNAQIADLLRSLSGAD